MLDGHAAAAGLEASSLRSQPRAHFEANILGNLAFLEESILFRTQGIFERGPTKLMKLLGKRLEFQESFVSPVWTDFREFFGTLGGSFLELSQPQNFAWCVVLFGARALQKTPG